MVSLLKQQLGNYRLLKLLGTGGFAEVYLGEHIHLGTQAAIKVLCGQFTMQDQQAFSTEARTIARLIHPHIVRVLEFGVEGQRPFLVMDYAPKGSLRDRHAQDGRPLPLDLVVNYTKQIASALFYAQSAKLIHRDIKPENMLVGCHDELLLSDFGIAVVAHSTRSQKKEDVVGTIDYMAPEQIKAHPVFASDQYALAAVVYEWLCGVPPYQGTSTEVLLQHLTLPPPALRTHVPTLPQVVEQVVLKALQKEPAQRFANVQLFAQALEQALFLHTALTSAPLPPLLAPISDMTRFPCAFLTYAAPLPTLAATSYAPVSARPAPGSLLCTYRGHSDHVCCVAWSADRRRIASAAMDGCVQIWEALTGKRLAGFVATDQAVHALEWSPDGKYIACGNFSGTLQTWTVSGKKISECSRSPYAVNTLSWSPDGKLIAFGCADGRVAIIHPQEGWEYKEYMAPAPITSLAWSPNGKKIALARTDDSVEVVSVARNSTYPDIIHLYAFSKVCTYHGHCDSVNTLAWAYDNQRIASGSEDGTVQIWNSATGEHISTYEEHQTAQMAVKTVAWSPDRKHLASAGDDGLVRVWDTATNDTSCLCQGHGSTVRTVAWSLDRKHLASGSEDTTVCVWTF